MILNTATNVEGLGSRWAWPIKIHTKLSARSKSEEYTPAQTVRMCLELLKSCFYFQLA